MIKQWDNLHLLCKLRGVLSEISLAAGTHPEKFTRRQNKATANRYIYGVGQLCLGTLLDIAFLNKLGRPNSRSQFTGIGIVCTHPDRFLSWFLSVHNRGERTAAYISFHLSTQ